MLSESDSKFPLPPCRICGAPGAGFHYGVNTCEACKGFFHRSLSNWVRYRCQNKGTCIIQHGKSKMCRLCRYHKCLDMGMSKAAIKTGRYNYKKKTHDILEVQQMAHVFERNCSDETIPRLNYRNADLDTNSSSNQMDTNTLTDTFLDGCQVSRTESCRQVSSLEIFNPDLFNSRFSVPSIETRDKSTFLKSKLEPLNSENVLDSKIILDLGFDQDTMLSESTATHNAAVLNRNIETEKDRLSGKISIAPGFSSCNCGVSCNVSSQGSPDSASSTCISLDTSGSKPPSLLTSPSLLPYASPSSSSFQSAGFYSGEKFPHQLQLTPKTNIATESTGDANLRPKDDSSMFPSATTSFTNINSPNPNSYETPPGKEDELNEFLFSGMLLTETELLLTTSKTSSYTTINELLYTDSRSTSNTDYLCSKNSQSGISPCEYWLENIESQYSFHILNDAQDSVTINVSDIERLYIDQDAVIRNLVDADEKYISQYFKEIPQEEIEKQQREHYEICKWRKQLFGQICRLHDNEYDQLYVETGIDADNRIQKMRDFAKAMEETIQIMVSFSMAIPGFSGLSKESKLSLIKYSRQEFCLLNLFKYVNLELLVYRGVETDWQCSLEMENSELRSTLNSVFIFLRKFKMLNLTLEECVVMRSLVIMAPDRMQLRDSKVISVIYDQLVSLIIYLLSKRFDRPMLIFAKIMSLITECRTKEEEMTKMFKKYNLLRYMPIYDKPFVQLMYSGIYF